MTTPKAEVSTTVSAYDAPTTTRVITGALWLRWDGVGVMVHDPRAFLEALADAMPAEFQSVATTYLTPASSTAGGSPDMASG